MKKAEIFYKDIGDYLSREEKLKMIRESRSILNPDYVLIIDKPGGLKMSYKAIEIDRNGSSYSFSMLN